MTNSKASPSALTRGVRIAGWAVLGLLFLAPFVAMQSGADVHWTANDFGVFGGLLLLIGLGCEVALRRLASWATRFAWAVTLVTAALLVLVNGAVGLMGSEQADANHLFGLVLAVVAVGIGVARADTGRMASVMVAAAITQIAVVAVISLGDLVPLAERTHQDALFSGPGFATLWLIAAFLFRKASR